MFSVVTVIPILLMRAVRHRESRCPQLYVIRGWQRQNLKPASLVPEFLFLTPPPSH